MTWHLILYVLALSFSGIVGVLGSEDVTFDVFGGLEKDMFPVAFTDYDSDKRTDLVVLTRNFSSFDIYFGSSSRPFLENRPKLQCDLHYNLNGREHPVRITGLVVADFTGDGVNDICVSFKPGTSSNDTDPTFVSIIKGNLDTLDCRDSTLLLNGTNSYLTMRQEPIIVDVNGDMIADLFGEVEAGERFVWVFERDGPEPLAIPVPCTPHCRPLSTPSLGGFVDIDGDFSPDILIMSEEFPVDKAGLVSTTPLFYLEVYGIEPEYSRIKLKLKKEIALVSGVTIQRLGNPLFLDINLKGHELQVLIPYCRNKKCSNSGFLVVDYSTEAVSQLNVKFEDPTGQKWTFLSEQAFPGYTSTISLRAGDYDLDGFPDLIGTLMIGGRSLSETETRSVLFMNVPCEAKNCTYPRTFSPNFELLESYTHVLNTAFYDFNENGILDILGVRRLTKTATANATYGVFVLENSPEYDAYFVKWIVTTGRCEARNCPPYGVMAPGASMKYSTISLNNKIKSFRASQVFRSNFALDLPGWLMGTGSSPNFIDKVVFGVDQHNTYTRYQIIPNSNLIAIPGIDRSAGWVMKHLISPSVEGAISTFHVLLLVCLVNASVVFLFHLREKKEDRLERHKDPMSMSALTFT